ncbi:restriction endonuclease subunit S, partial [Campylobacter coli]|nr:restriction endonuclease subunit S [Campylobacter coli]
TFGATGTNTIILFLRKKETFKQENHLISQDYSLIKERIEAENLKDNENFYQNYLSAYCDFRKFDKELYSNFLNGNLDSKLAELEAFKDYRNAFRQTSDYKKLKESKIYKESKDKQDLEDKAFLAYTQAIEKDKLLYFCLSLNQEVLIIKSPSDIKEQKKFLGYEWSNRKGDEGLKELHEPYLSPLFERGNPQNETKLNTLICKAFLKTLSDIPKDLQGYASKARLIDMMDFEKVEFNKAISLNVKSRDELNPFKNSKYELVRLGEVCDLNKIRNQASATEIEKMNLNSGNVKLLPSSKNYEWWTDEKTAGQFINEGEVITLGVARYANIKKHKGKFVSANNHILSVKDKSKIIFDFLYILLEICGQKLYKQGQQYPQFDTNIFYSFKIPLPPLEIQKQIVAECEKIEEQHNTLSLSIKEYQKLIKAMLQKSGIIEDNQEYELNSILENLQKLESKLDFNLLFSFIDDFTNARQEDLKKFKEFVKNIKAILDTLLISPKDGWKRISLKNEQYIELNPSKKEISKLDENMLVSFIEMASVSDKGYIQSKIDRSLNEVRKGYTYFIENDILIAKITPCMENGKCAIAKNLTNNIGFGSTEFHIFRAKTGLDSSFLFYNLNQQNIREKAALAMTGASGHKRVPISFYENLTIPLPPLEIQEKIVQNIELVEQQIDFLNLKLEFLEKEKEKILQKYLFS